MNLLDVIDAVEASNRARATDPDTAHEAARRVLSRRNTDLWLVLQLHAQHPEGLDDFRLAALAGRQQTSLGKRRLDLMRAGLIADTGRRALSPSNSPVIVWGLTERGREAAQQVAA